MWLQESGSTARSRDQLSSSGKTNSQACASRAAVLIVPIHEPRQIHRVPSISPSPLLLSPVDSQPISNDSGTV